jgi:hypothetical protein
MPIHSVNKEQRNERKTIVIKTISLLLFTLLLSSLNASIIEVCISGTKDFTRIDQAINNAAFGDTILVYPGVYTQELHLGGSLTLQSLYAIDPDPAHIENTIISVERFVNTTAVFMIATSPDRHVTINGFTITNNASREFPEDRFIPGGGIYVDISGGGYVSIKNNIIRDCLAVAGGGIAIRHFSWGESGSPQSHVLLENNQIFKN